MKHSEMMWIHVTCVTKGILLILAMGGVMCRSIQLQKQKGQVTVNNRPMIGILAEEETLEKSKGDFKINADYVKYLEAAGARAVPIKLFMPENYYQEMFQNLNGVIFPGGAVSILTSHYADTAKILYKLAMEANEKGDYFPLWGTCLGFQLLTALTSGKNLLTPFDSEDYVIPLTFSKDYMKSKLFSEAPKNIIEYLKTKNLSSNFHHYGLNPLIFDQTSSLKNFYHVLSTNVDRKGKEFISTFEAYKYPFYGTQWHPETNLVFWETPSNVSHTKEAVLVSQYMANFLVNEARKSKHHFPSPKAEGEAMIENFSPLFSGPPSFSSYYYFKKPVVDTCADELCCWFPLKVLIKQGTIWYAVFALLMFVMFTSLYIICTVSSEDEPKPDENKKKLEAEGKSKEALEEEVRMEAYRAVGLF